MSWRNGTRTCIFQGRKDLTNVQILKVLQIERFKQILQFLAGRAQRWDKKEKEKVWS